MTNEQNDSKFLIEQAMEKHIVAKVKLHLENPENEFGLVTILVNYKKQIAEELQHRIQSAYLKTPYEFGSVENKSGFDKGILHAAKICEEVKNYGY